MYVYSFTLSGQMSIDHEEFEYGMFINANTPPSDEHICPYLFLILMGSNA